MSALFIVCEVFRSMPGRRLLQGKIRLADPAAPQHAVLRPAGEGFVLQRPALVRTLMELEGADAAAVATAAAVAAASAAAAASTIAGMGDAAKLVGSAIDVNIDELADDLSYLLENNKELFQVRFDYFNRVLIQHSSLAIRKSVTRSKSRPSFKQRLVAFLAS